MSMLSSHTRESAHLQSPSATYTYSRHDVPDVALYSPRWDDVMLFGRLVGIT